MCIITATLDGEIDFKKQAKREYKAEERSGLLTKYFQMLKEKVQGNYKFECLIFIGHNRDNAYNKCKLSPVIALSPRMNVNR